MRGMARRLCPKCAAGILLLTQALWQLLFLLTVTVWRDITVLPPLAARAELLDRARWFWLLEAPDAGTANAAMISGMMNVAEHLEAWFCLIWIGVSLRRRWRGSPAAVRAAYVLVVLAGLSAAALLLWRTRADFLDMTAYCYLWQRALLPEILTLTAALLALPGRRSAGG